MQAVIKIKMNNEAFHECPNGTELARLLRDLANRVDWWTMSAGDSAPINDLNGTNVGRMDIINELEEE